MPKVRMQDGTVIEIGADALLDDNDQPIVLPTGPVFTTEDLERARSQEKDKLYGRIDGLTQTIEGLKEQVGGLTAEQQREKAEAEQERQRIAEEAARLEEGELDAKTLISRKEQEWKDQLAQANQTWEQKFAEAQAKAEQAEALAQREREFNDLKDYAQAQVQANADKIAPQLLQWINGNSKEEIDAAITRAVETTDAIAEEMAQLVGQQDPNMVLQGVPGQPVVPAPPALPGTRVTGGPVNQDPGAQYQTLTADQIKNMSLNEYAKLRGQIGIGGQGQNRGLFG